MQAHAQDTTDARKDPLRGGITLLGEPLPSIWDPKHFRVVPFVGPNGLVDSAHYSLDRNADGSPRKQGRGLSPVALVEGEVQITRYGKLSGYVLYEDVCRGTALSFINGRLVTVASLHPDVDGMRYWQAWKKFARMQLAGQAIQASAVVYSEDGSQPIVDKFGSQFYHPEIMRRREQYARGGSHVIDTDVALRDIFGEPDTTESSEHDPAPDDILAQALGEKPSRPSRRGG